MLRTCCAQLPVCTTDAACSASLIAPHAASPITAFAAASTTEASCRFVARAALQVSLITSDPEADAVPARSAVARSNRRRRRQQPSPL
eukprot:6202639-Pleurochrysis_carterae.AAC.1